MLNDDGTSSAWSARAVQDRYNFLAQGPEGSYAWWSGPGRDDWWAKQRLFAEHGITLRQEEAEDEEMEEEEDTVGDEVDLGMDEALERWEEEENKKEKEEAEWWIEEGERLTRRIDEEMDED